MRGCAQFANKLGTVQEGLNEAEATLSSEATKQVIASGVAENRDCRGRGYLRSWSATSDRNGTEASSCRRCDTKRGSRCSESSIADRRILGRVTVEGKVIEYRAFTLPDGTIHVGTIRSSHHARES